MSFIFFQTSYGLRWMSAEEREVNKQTISAVTLRSEESQYLEENAFAFNRMIVGSYMKFDFLELLH